MNTGLLAGLGAGLQYIADRQTKKEDRAAEMQMMERKAELAQRLEMQMQQAKMDYAKANPTYNKYIQLPTGTVMGFDERGGSRSVYEPAGDDRAAYLDRFKAELSAKDASEQAALARAALAKEELGLIAPKRIKLEAEAAKANRWQPSSARTPKDTSQAEAMRLDAAASKAAKESLGYEGDFYEPGTDPEIDAKYQEAYDAYVQKIKSSGAGQSAFGIFGDALNPEEDDE